MSENSNNDNPSEKKMTIFRSSKDFEPDMDTLLVTAQSSMIVDGINYLVKKNYSEKTMITYLEAVKGVDLFIKILERSQEGYKKIQKTIDRDNDSKKVELFAFELYKKNYNNTPDSLTKIIKSFEILKQKLQAGYYKSLIKISILEMKAYFLVSSGVNQDKIDKSIANKSIIFLEFIDNLKKRITIAIEILKSNDPEIEKGMKGKNASIFIIKASELLYYYYNKIGKKNEADFYQKLHIRYKKYIVIRD